MEMKQCGACRGTMKFKSGTNKNGKSWAGFFCENKECRLVEWQKSTPGSKATQNAEYGAIRVNYEQGERIIKGLQLILEELKKNDSQRDNNEAESG